MAMLAAACASGGPAPASAQIGSGKPSLLSPPFTEPMLSTPNAPPHAEPSKEPGDSAIETVASRFDPARQHFVWVLPPGVRGKGPWTITATVALDGKPQLETALPLVAEKGVGGSRPEYPAGYEIIRLTDHGDWARNTAGIDTLIRKLVAAHGRGHGSLELSNDLDIEVDAGHRKAYCVDGQKPDIRLYVEDTRAPGLVRSDAEKTAGIIQAAMTKACEG
jgi:hypothetical protein